MNDREDAIKTPPSAVDDLVGRTLGRFRIESRIGSGGMGYVYKAQDTVLKRTVAIKRLAPQLHVSQINREKFLREAQRSSALNHPNIAAIYDVLEQDGEAFLVMEYIEGKTLRQYLVFHKFTIPEFLQIAIQCAEALAVAHEQKILHGDIKPENIMLTPLQRVKILDFGVARRFAFDGPNDATMSVATMSNNMSGTPAYMAPEILEQKAYDGRADIFSLGLVFYEMLGGRQPFLTDSFAGTLGRVLHTDPPPITSINRAVPGSLAAIVSRLLKKDPDERYLNARLLGADLQSVLQGSVPQIATATLTQAPGKHRRAIVLAVLFAIAIAGAAGLLIWSSRVRSRGTVGANASGAPTLPQRRVLAILPFDVAGDDPQLAALGQGLVDSIASRLGSLTEENSLEVISPQKIQQMKVASLGDAAKLFGANLGLRVELRPADELVRVSYSITEASTGRVIGGDVISVPATDAFTVEHYVLDGTVRALQLNLRSEEQAALRVHGTSHPEAYRDYLQARGYLLNFTSQENVDNAQTMIRDALKIDPNFGMARAALGEAYWREYWHKKDPKWPKLAKRECDGAIQLGNAGAAGHACLGVIADGTGDYKDAITEYQSAVQLDPGSEDAYIGLALAYEHDGQITKAEQTHLAALSARPHSWITTNALGNFYLRRNNYDQAAAMFQKVTELSPEGYAGYVNLGATYNDMGRFADAISALKKSIALRPSYAAYVNIGTAYFGLHDYAHAAEAGKEALKIDPNRYITWGNLGEALYYSGAKAEAATNYRKAIELATEELKVNPHDSYILSNVANYYSMLGQKQQALDYLQKSLQYGKNDKEILITAAFVYNQLGETGLALEWLQKAVTAGYPMDQVKNEPGLQNLISQIHFTEPSQKTQSSK
jgi:serine/threonine-protein kinase